MQGSAPVAELHDGLVMGIVHSDAIAVSLREHPPPARGGIFSVNVETKRGLEHANMQSQAHISGTVVK